MKLDTEFYRLPLRFDAQRLAAEVTAFSEEDWRRHPQGHAGNSALPFIALQGDVNDDGVKGPMRETPHLARCPYVRQVLAALNTVLGRTRLMRIDAGGEATPHVDTNYYWMQRVRVHVPIVTFAEVTFVCGDRQLHMPAGETWIFNTWKRHNVLNPTNQARIHLVVDTIGSGPFWDLVAKSYRPFASSDPAAPEFIAYAPDSEPTLQLENVNFPLVMTPWEQRCLVQDFFGELVQTDDNKDQVTALRGMLDHFQRDWWTLWAQHGEDEHAWPAYRELVDQLQTKVRRLHTSLRLSNGTEAIEMLHQAIIRTAVNPEVGVKTHISAPVTTAGQTNEQRPVANPPREETSARKSGRTRFERPIIIVAAPRSGSTLLFETLSRSPDVWTIGGESHAIFEQIEELTPAGRGFDSNRLLSSDATDKIARRIQQGFAKQLRDRDGNTPSAERLGEQHIRLLEKTPKNALRIPFLNEIFPDALFIYLYRDPIENLSSIIEAWRSRRFVTYRNLPGWQDSPWSLLLIPDWQELHGKPLEEIAAAQWISAHRTILDDLRQLERKRWCGVVYADLLADPQSEIERLCDFAGIGWDQQLEGDLPLARHTLTPPDRHKWRKNAAEIERVLPRVEQLATEVRQAIDHSRKRVQRVAALRSISSQQEKTMTSADKSANGSPLRSVHSTTLPQMLEQGRMSLLVTTYQAGRLIVARPDNGVLNTHFRHFSMPMGLALNRNRSRLAMGTKCHVWEFHNQGDVAAKLEPAGKHDACFLTRSTHVTGDIRIHEIAWGNDELWIVNTRFCCLCTLDRDHNFVPRWRPSFVSSLAPEDRCHLNGLAVVDDRPKYVTCLGTTDTPNGWRENKAFGGCLIDVDSNEIIAEGLSMPHSPRWYKNRLWVLESGAGTLAIVDEATGKLDTVARLPGFTRGLDFVGPYAFIGLSQVRESAIFSGIPITERSDERNCGVWVVNIQTGKTVAFVRFEGNVEEIFAVQILPDFRYPDVIVDDEAILGSSFVLPDEALAEVALTAR